MIPSIVREHLKTILTLLDILERGDGSRMFFDKALIVNTLVGRDTRRSQSCSSCENELLSSASLYAPLSIITMPDGSLVVGDYNLIRRISPDRQRIEVVLEIPSNLLSHSYHLAVDSATNELYVGLHYQVWKLKKLARVRDPKTNYRIVAGTGEECTSDCSSAGDNKAKNAKFHGLQGKHLLLSIEHPSISRPEF
jgi:hypothetical protein